MSSYGSNPFTPAFRSIPRATLVILLSCLVIWFVYAATAMSARGAWEQVELSGPGMASGKVWQLVTYQFLHAPFALTHVLFNCLGLLFFGPRLERRWGSAGFVRYFFACGIGGGIAFTIVALIFGDPTPVVGASGAILGLLMAWALLWPTDQILLMMVFPVQIRHAVLILGLIDVMLAWLGAMGSSATGAVAHVGGALTGWAYLAHAHRLRGLPGGGAQPLRRLKQWWRRRRMAVVERDFDQWLDKRDDDFRH